MRKDGLIFATIPNRLALFEQLFSYQHKKNLKRNTIDKSGIPHVNFKTCREWKDFLLEKGFTIKDHDMSMGFFVNDCFHGILVFILDFLLNLCGKDLMKKFFILNGS